MSTEPPDPNGPEDEPGEDLGRIPDSRIPDELVEVSGDENAVLFIPEGTDPSEALNVRVVSVDRLKMEAIIARRC